MADVSKINGYNIKDTTARTTADNAIPKSQKGAASGVAELDSDGKVPSSQLPSYVDDVLEYSAKASFPTSGETGKIYVDTSTNITYRWSGSAYVAIGSDLALGETSATAYRGDRGKTAYDHSQLTSGNPHNVTASDLGLATVATSGSYNDLSNKPTIPSGAAADKGVDTSISAASTSTNLPTSQAVASFVEGKGYKTTDNNTTYTLTQDSTDGHKITLTPSSGSATTITIPDNNTTYSSKSAASGGTDVSLVTTGEKYTWNNKTSNTGTVTSVKVEGSNGLSGSGTVTTSGTITLSNSGVRSITQDSSDGHKLTINTGGTSSTITIPDNDTTYSNATTSAAGLMSASDKTKLDGVATGATAVTTSTVSGWGYTKNTGTITGITMNGSSKGTSGVVDLGTVITAHQTLKTINGNTITGSGDITISSGSGTVYTSDDAVSTTSSTIDADTLGGNLPSYYATKTYVDTKLGDIETLLAAL